MAREHRERSVSVVFYGFCTMRAGCVRAGRGWSGPAEAKKVFGWAAGRPGRPLVGTRSGTFQKFESGSPARVRSPVYTELFGCGRRLDPSGPVRDVCGVRSDSPGFVLVWGAAGAGFEMEGAGRELGVSWVANGVGWGSEIFRAMRERARNEVIRACPELKYSLYGTFWKDASMRLYWI
jgi:hypothetical protein